MCRLRPERVTRGAEGTQGLFVQVQPRGQFIKAFLAVNDVKT